MAITPQTPTPSPPEQQPPPIPSIEQPTAGALPPARQTPPPPQWTPPPPPPTRPRGWRPKPWQWGLIGLAALVVIAIIAVVANPQPTPSPVSPTATLQPTTATTAAPTTAPTLAPTAIPQPTATLVPSTPTPASTTPTYAQFGSGTFVVGKDIQAGTYRTRTASSGCYWERLSGFGGSLNEIVANDLAVGPAVVTIAASDKGFSSHGCATWTANLSQITQSKTSFGDGTYIVGTDVEPGTYKSDSSQTCYYERLSGFGGTLDDIVANNVAEGPSVVTIAASDKGFSSHGCGTWTKQ